MTDLKTLRDIAGLDSEPATLSDAALVMIDCQNTYRRGVMQLTGVEAAIVEAQRLLEMARDLKSPIIHIRHDAGPGSPYDVSSDIGAISDEVTPRGSEPVITKNFPNAFVQTALNEQLKAMGIQKVILAGFMTHMCVNSTARGAFNLGYAPTIVAKATATRPLPGPTGESISAQAVQVAALAGVQDLFAVVVSSADDVQR
jgi:nicotinamidase-related amidase